MLPDKLGAQEKLFVISDSIQWQPPKIIFPGHELLFFVGAVNHDSLGFLPVYYYSIPKEYNGRISSAFLIDAEYASLETLEPSEFPDLDLIGTEPVIILSTIYNRKIPAQSIYLLPLRKAPGKEGYEKLVSFTIQFNLENSQIPEANFEANLKNYVEHSVLSSGDWYRIATSETGIHRITYQDLVDMGIKPDQINPRNIRLFGNGSGMVEEANSASRPDDLIENTIYINGEEDGVFDQGDYILFYGEDPVVVEYNPFYLQYDHEVNFYTEETYYFLTVGDSPGKRVVQGEVIAEPPTHELYNFQDFAYHEKDSINLIKSGKTWYGEVFNTKLEYTFPFDLKGIDLSQPVYFKASLAARSTVKTAINIYTEGDFLTDLDVPSVLIGSYIYARPVISNYESFYAKDENVEVGVNFIKPGSLDAAWLDFIELNYIRHLNFTSGQLDFRDMRYIGAGNIIRYHISTAGQGLVIWEVTEPGSISQHVISNEPGGIALKAIADKYREFIAFDGSEFYSPVFIEKVANQDLHGFFPADYVIVSHPFFLDQANRLADYHWQYDGMSVVVVTPQQIYNEFSSGVQDVSAIRDFMKMLYARAEPKKGPRYLLLFGDASYDYKNLTSVDDNLVPTYEARESLKYTASFATDDFFGCLDDNEGGNGLGTMDIGIGRFPVKTIEEAVTAVDKAIQYMMPARENMGPWRNSIVYIGDDEDNNTHLKQAEGLALITDSLAPVYNVNKIYLDAYQQLQTPGGTRIPEANAAIDKAVTEGCLIINYTGHGGEVGWAAERILDIPAIQAYNNLSNMPAFVTATCEFSRYDDPGLVSAGELVFMNPEGAGIGLFTTTRLAYSQSNYTLNQRFYYGAFSIDSLSGQYPRMGDLIRVAKTPSNQNIKNFVLLGDPALMLAYPKYIVLTDSIKNADNGKLVDTLHALSRVTIFGHIENNEGIKQDGFYGLLYPSVLDKPIQYKTRGNDQTSKIVNFYMQDKIIYKGAVSITNGEFTFTFVVPLDISYNIGEGKISYYAIDTVDMTDAHGYDPVRIGGSERLSSMDETGPSIELFLNTLSFKSGDLTTSNPLLIAGLSDESGINFIGNGIGHDLVLILDNNYQEPLVLNEYFTPETNSYQKGDIFYQLMSLSNGTHTLTIKAWDVMNNSSEKTIEFRVDVGVRLAISSVYNYPNPFTNGTSFVFEHNKPGFTLKVTIRIFDLTGQQVSVLNYILPTENIQSSPLFWNGLDDSGGDLPSGLFIYHFQVESDDGFISYTSQKFLHYKE
jgi:hypothetical protein